MNEWDVVVHLDGGQLARERVRQSRADGDEGDGVDRVLQVDEAAEVGGDVPHGRSHHPDPADGE